VSLRLLFKLAAVLYILQQREDEGDIVIHYPPLLAK